VKPVRRAAVAVSVASALVARGQAAWIAAMEPWRGLGYGANGLGVFLARSAAGRQVRVARARGARGPVDGIMVLQPAVLLGSFVALLAVRPEAAGRGIGRALIEHAEAEAFATRRWLFVSADAGNRAALAFYRKLGFERVGRLPDLVKPGRVEVLLRKGRGG
jgi:ribosomal protein S18 acetylase RimI-like enzyme